MGAIIEPIASLPLAVAVRCWHCTRIVMERQNRTWISMEPVGHVLSMTAELLLKTYLPEWGTSHRMRRAIR